MKEFITVSEVSRKVTGLPAGQSFLPTLFQTPEGEESALTEAGNDGVPVQLQP